MKEVLTWGLVIIGIGLSGLHLHSELIGHPKELEQRTKIAWYVGCIEASVGSGNMPPEFAKPFCDQGYETREFDVMIQAIEDNKEFFFLNHE